MEKLYRSPTLQVRLYGLISSVQRSEILTLERDKARYVRFLDKYIPKDAPVVLPYSLDSLNSQSVMQYYLFPRPILACCGAEPDSGCMQCLTQKDTFVPALKNFPGPEWMRAKAFVPYPGSDGNLLGVYVPADMAGRLPIPTTEEFGHTQSISLSALIIDAMILILFFIMGIVVVLSILPEPQWLDLLGLSFPLALGMYTWLLFLSSYAGIPISLSSMGLCFVSLFALFLILHYLQFGFSLRLPRFELGHLTIKKGEASKAFVIFLVVVAIAWFLISGFIAIGRAYSTFDDIANWSLKGYAMASTGSIYAGNRWGGHVLAYPMNLALSIGTFRLADGDVLPGSKAIFPIFAASLIIGCLQFLRRYSGDRVALLGGLFIATMPLFFFHSTIGLANLPFTCYLVLGVLYGLQGILDDKGTRYLLMSGFLFALSGWTRPEGIGFSLVMIVVLSLLAVLLFRRRIGFKQIAVLVLPLLIIPGIWYVLIGANSMREDQIGLSLSQFLPQFLNGNLHLGSLNQIISYGVHYFFGNWFGGFIVLVALVCLLVGLPITHWHKDRLSASLLALATTAGLVPAGMFFVASFHENDFPAFLNQSFDRAYLPAITLLVVTALIAVFKSRGPNGVKD